MQTIKCSAYGCAQVGRLWRGGHLLCLHHWRVAKGRAERMLAKHDPPSRVAMAVMIDKVAKALEAKS